MTDNVYAVEVLNTGLWEAACCDDRCGSGVHVLADQVPKGRAEAAVTVHRKLLATMPDEGRWPPKPSQCPTCLQSKSAIAQLQELVRRLEEQLAEATGGAS